MSSHGDEAQRVGQTASAWCHGGGQTTAFPVVRSGSLTTALAPDLDKRMVADVRERDHDGLAAWRLTWHTALRERRPLRVRTRRDRG